MRQGEPPRPTGAAEWEEDRMLDPKLAGIERTLGPSAFPKKLALELCADCNFACTMCHHPEMRRPKGVMPFELWKKCADEVAAVSPSTEVWFSFCGEPLLEPFRLIEYVRYGKSIGLESVNVNTNGQLLVPEIAGPLLDSGVDTIVIGLDGFSAEVYEKVRVNGQRDVVYDNVIRLLKEREARGLETEIHVQFIEMDENEHELTEFATFWHGHGATVKARNKLSWGGKFETPVLIPDEERIACPWAMTMMHVFWDGRVPRCPGDTEGEDNEGNAWHGTLTALWAELGDYRNLHLTRQFAALPERCHTCKDWMTGAAERVRPGALERLERRRGRGAGRRAASA
jgi:pyruvate-formate lyase-activating enzyme